MAQAQHTPGPWFANKNTAGYYDISTGDTDYSPSFAAAHQNPYMQVDADVLDANAHLIAAGPDMLEALEKCEPFIRSGDVDTRGGKAELSRLAGIMRAAIAKAEGRAQ